MLAAFAVSATSQAQFISKWAYGSGTIADKPVMSNNGYYMAVRSGNDYKFYSLPASRLLGTLNAPGAADAAFSSDSLHVYIASGTRIYNYRYDGTAVNTVVTETNAVVKVAASADGTKLAYVAHNTGLGEYQLVGVDLGTSTETYRTTLSGPPSNLVFTQDSSKVVVDGPNVYDATTGASVVNRSNDAGPFAVAWDGTYIVEWSAADPTVLECRNLADGSFRWSITPTVTNYTGGSIAITYNGDRVLIPGRTANGKVGIWVYRTSDGSFVSMLVPSGRTDKTSSPATAKVSLATNPANVVVASSADVPTASDDYVVNETYVVYDDSRSRTRDDLSRVAGPITSLAMTKQAVSGGAPLTIYGSASGIGNTDGNVVVRNADTGDLVQSWSGVALAATPGAVGLSTDGAYAAYGTPTSLVIRSVATGAVVGTLGLDVRSVAWADGTTVLAALGNRTVRKYSVATGTPVLQSVIPIGGVSGLMAVNPAGTIALALGPGQNQWTRIDLATSAVNVYTTTVTGKVTFLDFDSTGYAYVGQNDTGTTMNLRRWDVTSTTPVGLYQYSRTFPTTVDNPYYAVSPGGKFLLIGANYPKDPASGDLRTSAKTYLINPVNALTAMTWDDPNVGDGLSAVAISPGSSYMVWGRKDPGVICVAIASDVSSVALTPNPAASGASLSGTITMSAGTPGPFNVFLKSSDPSIITVPDSVLLTADQTSVAFDATTAAVDEQHVVTIRAYTSRAWTTCDVTVNPAVPATVTIPSSLNGGTTTGTVTLDGKAGPSGTVVTLTSSDPAVSVPATVTVPSGETSVGFDLTVTPVSSDTPVTISATAHGTTATADTTVKNGVKTVVVNPTTLCSGGTATGTVTLYAPAKSGGEVVTLASSSGNATVPATVTVAQGSTTATFSIGTTAVAAAQTVTITGSNAGGSASGTFTLELPGVKTLVMTRASVVGGNSATATLTLTSAVNAPIVVNLTSNNPTVASVPATVTIPANTTSVTITITTTAVGANTVVSITASRFDTSVSTPLTVTPPR